MSQSIRTKFAVVLVSLIFASGALVAKGAEKSADDDAFVALFDGETLEGWNGDTKGYQAKDGVLLCTKEGGFLFSEKEYGDFHLKFQFKLTPGANNGLCIRAPRDGNPAYSGMELQILDDTADQYKDLQPYQYHGSVYGIVPAKRGHLKPVGEWNAQEVICDGDHIVVKLNGATIIDADLRKATESGAMDGKEHPGARRKSGHLVFYGHDAVVAFRDISIKEL